MEVVKEKKPSRPGRGTGGRTSGGSGIIQKVQTYIAPKLFGGQLAKTPIGGTGFPSPADSVLLKNSTITQLGEDFLIESEVERDVYRHR